MLSPLLLTNSLPSQVVSPPSPNLMPWDECRFGVGVLPAGLLLSSEMPVALEVGPRNSPSPSPWEEPSHTTLTRGTVVAIPSALPRACWPVIADGSQVSADPALHCVSREGPRLLAALRIGFPGHGATRSACVFSGDATEEGSLWMRVAQGTGRWSLHQTFISALVTNPTKSPTANPEAGWKACPFFCLYLRPISVISPPVFLKNCY